MKVKHAPLIALCTMATSIVAMGFNPKPYPLSEAMFVQGTANVEYEMLMTDARLLAEHLGCTDKGCIDGALMLLDADLKEMVELYDPVEIDDDYADSDANETICQWSSDAPNYQYPNFRYKIWNTSCVVTKMPEDPYPDDVETWFQKKEWRINNPEEWKAYTQKVKVSRRNATYYLPYDEEKCNEINGVKSRFYQVPYRYARVVEMKNCPLTYPEDLDEYSPEKEPNPDNTEENGTDDTYVKKIVVTGQVNPVKPHHGQFSTDEVPSPHRDWRLQEIGPGVTI